MLAVVTATQIASASTASLSSRIVGALTPPEEPSTLHERKSSASFHHPVNAAEKK
jgi:hypothetical protein